MSRCACASHDASECVRLRYDLDLEDTIGDADFEPCTCICHDDEDRDDEDPVDVPRGSGIGG